MTSTTRLVRTRLRSHRLSAPAATVPEAAHHMLAVQAQEFWGGRWALASRTSGAPTLTDVDTCFDEALLVRSWPLRGTIHVTPAADLGWILQVTADRQRRQAASRRGQLGLDAPVLQRARHTVSAALRGGGRLQRGEVLDVLESAGISTADGRGYHLLYTMSVDGLICQGPVVPRAGAPTREQYFVLADEWIPSRAIPADPLAELFVRYITGHGPAGIADFVWWSGLTATLARQAAEASADRLVEVDEGVFIAPGIPRTVPRAPRVIALASFDEYYLSYADRTRVAAPEHAALVGPGKNGMVRPILLADGVVAGTWSHSKAVGRHEDDPVPELFDTAAASEADVAAALDRYARFIGGR